MTSETTTGGSWAANLRCQPGCHLFVSPATRCQCGEVTTGPKTVTSDLNRVGWPEIPGSSPEGDEGGMRHDPADTDQSPGEICVANYDEWQAFLAWKRLREGGRALSEEDARDGDLGENTRRLWWRLATALDTPHRSSTREQPAPPITCAVDNGDGYDCELPREHEGDHRALINARDEIGVVPELRWRRAASSQPEARSEEAQDDASVLLGNWASAARRAWDEGRYVDYRHLTDAIAFACSPTRSGGDDSGSPETA